MKTNLALLIILVGLIAYYVVSTPEPPDTGIAEARSQLIEREVQEKLRQALRIDLQPGPQQIAEAQAQSELDLLDEDYLAPYELPERLRLERQYHLQPGGQRGGYSGWYVTTHGNHPARSRVVSQLRSGLRRMHRGETIIDGGELSPSLLERYGLDEENALRLEIYTHRQETQTGADGRERVEVIAEPLFGMLVGRSPEMTAEARESFSPVGFRSDETEARFVRLARTEEGEGRESGRFIYDGEIRLVDNVPANLINLANINEWIDLGVTKVGDRRIRLEDIYRVDFGGSGIEEPFSLQRLGEAPADRLWAQLDEHRTEQELGEALGRETNWYFASPGKVLVGDGGEQADAGEVRAAMSHISGYDALAFHSVNERGTPEEPHVRIRIFSAQELMRVRRAEQVLNEWGLWNAIMHYLQQMQQRDPELEDVHIPIGPLVDAAQRQQMDRDGVVNFLLNNMRENFLEPVFQRDETEEQPQAGLPDEAQEMTVPFPYGQEVRELSAVRFVLAGNDPRTIERHVLERMQEILPNAQEVVQFHESASTVLYLIAEQAALPREAREYQEMSQQLEYHKELLRRVVDGLEIGEVEGAEKSRAEKLIETAEAKAQLRIAVNRATVFKMRAFWQLLAEYVREAATTQIRVDELLEWARPLGIGRETVRELAFVRFGRQVQPLTAADLGLSAEEAEELDGFTEETTDGDKVRIVAFDVPDAIGAAEALQMRFLSALAEVTPNLRLSEQPSQQEVVERLTQVLDDVTALIELEVRYTEAEEEDERGALDEQRKAALEELEELLGADTDEFASLAAEIGKSRALLAAGEMPPEETWDVRTRYREARELAVSRFWRTFYDSFATPHTLVVVADEPEPEAERDEEENGLDEPSYRVTASQLRPSYGFWYEMTADVAERWAYSREKFQRDAEEDEQAAEPSEEQAQTQPAGVDWEGPSELVEAPATPRVALMLRDAAGMVEDEVLLLELFEDHAPNAVANFLHQIEAGAYDGMHVQHFQQGHEIRFGEPSEAEYELPLEFDPALAFDEPAPLETADELHPGAGRVAMLAGEQGGDARRFLITLSGSAARNEANLIPFAQVVEGMHLFTRLGVMLDVEEGAEGQLVPSQPVWIERARVLAKRDHAYEVERLPVEEESLEEEMDTEQAQENGDQQEPHETEEDTE